MASLPMVASGGGGEYTSGEYRGMNSKQTTLTIPLPSGVTKGMIIITEYNKNCTISSVTGATITDIGNFGRAAIGYVYNRVILFEATSSTITIVLSAASDYQNGVTIIY